MTRHYIRLDADNSIMHGFSDQFEQPQETDICINEDGGRHFEMLGVINPNILENNIYLYKYTDGEVQLRTAGDKELDLLIVENEQAKSGILAQLNQLDTKLTRGTEDVIDLLLNKSLISESDIPTQLAENRILKAFLRNSLNTL